MRTPGTATVWFAVHVAFASVTEWRGFGVRLLLPDLPSANLASMAIALGAFIAMFKLKWNMILTLGIAAAVGSVHTFVILPWLTGV